MVGAGTDASETVKSTDCAASDVLPAASVAVAVTWCSPRPNVGSTVQRKVPAAVAVAEQSVVPPAASDEAAVGGAETSVKVTELPASAVPLSTGVCLRVGEV